MEFVKSTLENLLFRATSKFPVQLETPDLISKFRCPTIFK